MRGGRRREKKGIDVQWNHGDSIFDRQKSNRISTSTFNLAQSPAHIHKMYKMRSCASVKLSFHDQFAFLFVLTAVKYLVKYIGYDHFAHAISFTIHPIHRFEKCIYVEPIKQSNVRRIILRWQILYWISFHVPVFFFVSFYHFPFYIMHACAWWSVHVCVCVCVDFCSVHSHNLLLHTVIFIQWHPIYT